MSAPRYEVRTASGSAITARFADLDRARRAQHELDAEPCRCGPHRVWSIDPDGTETDITDEQGAQE